MEKPKEQNIFYAYWMYIECYTHTHKLYPKEKQHMTSEIYIEHAHLSWYKGVSIFGIFTFTVFNKFVM